MPAGSRGVVAAPTYPMLRDETLRTFLLIAKQIGVLAAWRVSEMRAVLVDGKEVLFRSTDNPDSLRGSNLGWFWLDEAAYSPESAWLVMIGRVRRAPGRGWITTSPSGHNWVESRFMSGDPDYDLVRARTRDNPYLPESYVHALEQTYSGTYAAQELDGQFVDLDGAGLFRVGLLEILPAAPVCARRVRAWDLAATDGAGDYTAGVLLGADADGRYAVLDVVRGQWEPAERNRVIRQTAAMDGKDVPVWGPQDPAAAGKESAQAFTRLLAGWNVKTALVSGNKVQRADPVAAQVNAGNVRLAPGPWNRAFVEELRTMPNGQHDDQVDALSSAFAELTAPEPQGVRSWLV